MNLKIGLLVLASCLVRRLLLRVTFLLNTCLAGHLTGSLLLCCFLYIFYLQAFVVLTVFILYKALQQSPRRSHLVNSLCETPASWLRGILSFSLPLIQSRPTPSALQRTPL